MSLALSLGARYTLESGTQFDAELDDIIETCNADKGLESLDQAFRAYIAFAAEFYDQYLQHDADLDRCLGRLLQSFLFRDYRDRMINAAVDIIATTKDPPALHISLSLLLKKGATQSHIYRQLRKSRPQTPHAPSVLAVCMSLVDQFGINSIGTEADGGKKPHPAQERLGVTATVVLYEICRVSRFEQADLGLFTEPFISHLFRLVESTRDGDEIFNFSIVRLIISLNEQFMVASVDDSTASPVVHSSPGRHHRKRPSEPLHVNRVLKTLTEQLGALKTFGENLIFILNRLDTTSEDLCVSLLILKMLYLLFSTPATHEYFYTNDLCVLVDVFIRQLSDLPDESEGLRHTYLRVLHPLLTNTQLREHPYKRQHLRRVLKSLIADENIREVDATTKRLAERNLRAEWCTELERTGLSLPVAAKQAGTPLSAVAPLPATGDLPVIGRTASRASVTSTSSDTSAGPMTGSTSTFGGRMFAEPNMSGSVLSVAEMARTMPNGQPRPMSSSSDLGISRTGSPAPSQSHSEDELQPPRRGSSMLSMADPASVFLSPPTSPIARASSAGSNHPHRSPSRRAPPPLPEGASARRRVHSAAPPAAKATAATPHKSRRPPPPRPGDPNPRSVAGLRIDSLTVS